MNNFGQAGHLPGQPVQMNLGSGRGLDQQPQLLQVPSHHLGMDPHFSRMRGTMHQNILHCLIRMKPGERQNFEKLAERLEHILYRLHPTKADYCVMLNGPIEPHLQDAVKFLSHQGHQRQQMSHQTPTSSHYGTMIPTPGSMPNGYQDPSIRVLQNSVANSDSSVLCSVSKQRQVPHMIPTPGFSRHKILPSNPVYPCGAGYLNEESNVLPQVHEQKPMAFSINQSSYPMQHLDTHVGSGVHSRTLEDSSSYGLSGPQINGDMGLPGSNMQLSYRTVAAKEFMNLPHGSSPEKLLQQEFICHPPQGTPTSACGSGNFHGAISSPLTPTGNQSMNAANMFSSSRTECALLSQTTKQPLQPTPVVKDEVVDQMEKVMFRESQFPHHHQQQHYFEPNHPCSQFVKESQLSSCCDDQLSNQGIMPYNELMYSKETEDNDVSEQMYRPYVSHNNDQIISDSQQLLSSHVKNTEVMDSTFQRKMTQDAAEQHVSSDRVNAGCAMTPNDHILPKLPTRGSEYGTNKYNLKAWQLIMFIHAKFCPGPRGSSCKLPACARAQEILKHSNDCQIKDCSYDHCERSKKAIHHYNNCVNKHCPICSKANESLRHYCDQTNKWNTAERSINGSHGDRMGISMVSAETFDNQPPISKRSRLQPVPSNVSDSADASVPQVRPGFVPRQAHPKHLGQDKRIFPKQEKNIEINIKPPQKVEIIRSGTVSKTGAIQSYVVPGVSNELDSHVEKENWLSNKDTNESVLDIENDANGSTDAMMSKIEKKYRERVFHSWNCSLQSKYMNTSIA